MNENFFQFFKGKDANDGNVFTKQMWLQEIATIRELLIKGSAELILLFIPASNEPSDCLQEFGDCREGQIPRPLGRFKFDAPLLAAGF